LEPVVSESVTTPTAVVPCGVVTELVIRIRIKRSPDCFRGQGRRPSRCGRV